MCLAVPGKVILVNNDDGLMRTGKVDFGGIVKDVNFAFVPDVQIYNYVLVHAGFAIGKLDEKIAQQTLSDIDKYLEENIKS